MKKDETGMSEEKKIMLNGVEHKLSDLTAGQIAIVQQINHCASKIQLLDLDMGQAKMAYDGFIQTLEHSLIHKQQEPTETDSKSV